MANMFGPPDDEQQPPKLFKPGTLTNTTVAGDASKPGPVIQDPAADAFKPGTLTNTTVAGDAAKPGPVIQDPAADAFKPGPMTNTTIAGDASKPGPVISDPAAPTMPQFDQSWFGDKQWWNDTASNRGATVPWQLLMATKSGQMSPEQRAYVEQQIAAGANAANPYAAPATPTAPPPGAPAPGAPPAPSPVPGMPTTAADVTNSAAPAGQTTPQGTPTTIAGSFQQALINKLNPGPVSVNDPSVQPAIRANQLAEQRGLEAQRAQLAEQAAHDGTDSSGAFRTNLAGLTADSAARQGQFAGDAVQHQSDLNNQALLAALGLGGGFLQQNATRDQQGSQFAQSLAEQKRQADQDAELRKLGITTQGSLGQGDLALRGRLGEGQLNLGLLGALLQNNQFGRQLDQQGAQFGQSLDLQGLLGLLGNL